MVRGGVPYREQVLCAYCDALASSRCTRCGCRLCDEHEPDREGWCWACVKEVRDELEIEHFKTVVGTPVERRYDGVEAPMAGWHALAGLLASFRKRRLRKKLVARKRKQIEAWRREAGIRTRW